MINYNNADLILNCIRSIYEHTSKAIRYRIVVVDNTSEPDDFKKLENQLDQEEFRGIVLVRNIINAGFGGGNMLGIHHVNATYYAFINDDTKLLNDCLSILMNHLEQNPGVAICGPELLDENHQIQVGSDHFASLQREVFGQRFLEYITEKISAAE